MVLCCFVLLGLVVGCSSPPPTAVGLPPPTADTRPTPTVDLTTAEGLLATAVQRTLALQSVQWTTRITGLQDGAIIDQTETTCALRIPRNEAYCATRVLLNPAYPDLLELVQLGATQWGRQGNQPWQQVGGQTPSSIVLHELMRFENGRLQFHAHPYIRTAAIVGEETIAGQTMSIIAAEFDTQAYNVLETWYGPQALPEQPASQTLSSRLWVGQLDGFIHASTSTLTTRIGDQTLELNLDTNYLGFNQPVTIPQIP